MVYEGHNMPGELGTLERSVNDVLDGVRTPARIEPVARSVPKVWTLSMLTYLREQLSFLTIEASIVFLRHLGGFERDKIIVLSARGYARHFIWELPQHVNGSVPVDRLRPIYFEGGPSQAKRYKGNYLTFLVDRAMLVMREKGKEYVDAVVEYSKGFIKEVRPVAN